MAKNERIKTYVPPRSKIRKLVRYKCWNTRDQVRVYVVNKYLELDIDIHTIRVQQFRKAMSMYISHLCYTKFKGYSPEQVMEYYDNLGVIIDSNIDDVTGSYNSLRF